MNAVPAYSSEELLAEDLLLLLFQPDSGLRRGAGVIAGEDTLFYPLGGAVLAAAGPAGRTRSPAPIEP